MPTTIFDWIARTAMLAMAGLVTLSILGAIAAMTNDPGTRFTVPRDRPQIAGEPAREGDERQAEAPSGPGEGNLAESAVPGSGGATTVAIRSTPEDKTARWLEAIAYALLAIAGVCALGVLMLWNVLRELRRLGHPG
ncbi:MAG TPA: hypothetical protein VE891_05190 [Allosphingosinicella sp.]|nr:hypothetical protein [Allosphingosinicella sp.]